MKRSKSLGSGALFSAASVCFAVTPFRVSASGETGAKAQIRRRDTIAWTETPIAFGRAARGSLPR